MKTKGYVKIRVISALTVFMICCVLAASSMITNTFAAANLVIPEDYIVFTDNDTTISLKVSEKVNGLNLCAFTKDTNGKFTKEAFSKIDNTDTASFTAKQQLIYNQKTEYYVAVTDKNETKINEFDGKTGTVTTNNAVLKADDETELYLTKILVVYDKKPVITDISGMPEVWTNSNVKLTVFAQDEDGAEGLKYSFDDGASWHTNNYETFTSNQEIKIKVKDECGQESDVCTRSISLIDTLPPSIAISDLTEKDGWFIFKGHTSFTVTAADQLSGIKSKSLSVTASGATSNVTDLGNGKYKVELTYNGQSKKVNVSMTVADNAGNTAIKDNLVIDAGNPTAQIINTSVDDSWKKDSSSFEFTATDAETGIDLTKCISDIPSENGNVLFSAKEGVTDTYIAKITAYENKKINQQVKLTIKDKAGNPCEITTDKNIRIDNEKPGIKDISVINKTKPSNSAVKSGDTAQISFKLDDDDGAGCDNTQTVSLAINGSDIKTATLTDGKYTCDFVIGVDAMLNDNDEITITKLVCTDKLGNNITAEDSVDFKTGTKCFSTISITNVTFASDNSESTLAKNDDTVSVCFDTNHIVNISGVISQDSNVSTGSPLAEYDRHTKKFKYKVWLKVKDITSYDGKAFKFNLTISDDADNDSIHLTDTYTGLKSVIYYAPIEKTISSANLTSDGLNSAYAKKNDTVSLSIKTNHPVNIESTRIAGSDTALTQSEDKLSWTGSRLIDGNNIADNSYIPLSLKITDAAGNVSKNGNAVTITQDDITQNVTYFDDIQITNIEMSSSNNDIHIAKNGNIISASFTTSHPVILTSAQIAGKNIAFTSIDNINWTGKYLVADGDVNDNDKISLKLCLDDSAGNESVSADESSMGTNRITYYAPITISELVITSSNQSNGTKYAKNGDRITVSFKSNHNVNITDTAIAGKNAVISESDGSGVSKNYTMSYVLQNGDVSDLSLISFRFKADDIAGNQQVSCDNAHSSVKNSIQYFRPITAVTSISSNYKNTDFAKNGDTVTVSVKANHNVTILNSTILNRATVNTNDNQKSLTMSYRFPANENNLPQGNIHFEYTVTDLAGNTLSVNSPSTPTNKVTYDRVNPQISMSPDFNGFTNKNITYTFTFTDDNLSAQDISVSVNGVEQITAGERTVNGNTFRKTIILSSENDYSVVASLLDSAGNKCNQDKTVKITIDKTAPLITSANVDLSKSASFKDGIKLSEILNIEEKYINEIICTITDSEGTHDIDINDPVTGDGKKTVNIIVKDMSGNTSRTMTYDFYIDATPPKIEISNTNNKTLSQDSTNVFKDRLNLLISLQSFGSKELDGLEKFTTLQIEDENGNVIMDILENETPLENGTYEINLDKAGKYVFKVEAVDKAGNDTGLMQYNLLIKDKNIIEKAISNTLFVIIGIIVIVALLGTAVFLRIKKRLKYRY